MIKVLGVGRRFGEVKDQKWWLDFATRRPWCPWLCSVRVEGPKPGHVGSRIEASGQGLDLFSHCYIPSF